MPEVCNGCPEVVSVLLPLAPSGLRLLNLSVEAGQLSLVTFLQWVGGAHQCEGMAFVLYGIMYVCLYKHSDYILKSLYQYMYKLIALFPSIDTLAAQFTNNHKLNSAGKWLTLATSTSLFSW